MTLRNALGDLALDDSITALTAAVEALHGYLQCQAPPRALPYARDAADRLRVYVDNTNAGAAISVSGTVGIGASGVVSLAAGASYWANGAAHAMDTRETQRELSMQTAQAVRGRWEIT